MEHVNTDPLAIDSWYRERLLEALEAYRRGVGEAPLLRKWTETGNQAATLRPVSPSSASKASQVSPEASPEASPMSFVLSTDEVDRHGDVISSGGWSLESYRQNPVLLTQYAHPFGRESLRKPLYSPCGRSPGF